MDTLGLRSFGIRAIYRATGSKVSGQAMGTSIPCRTNRDGEDIMASGLVDKHRTVVI